MKKFLLFFIVLISVIIYFSTTQSRENYRLFKQMCKNKEYRIEIVDGNYTIDDVKNHKFRHYETDKVLSCQLNRSKCPQKTTIVHDRNSYIGDRLIAKTYNVFRPFSYLEIAMDFEGTGINGEYCIQKDTNELLINFKRSQK